MSHEKCNKTNGKKAEQPTSGCQSRAHGYVTSGSEPVLSEKPATLEEWKAKAEALWILLDDIDTAGDMYKPEINGYFKYINKKIAKRFRHMQSDGYEIINT